MISKEELETLAEEWVHNRNEVKAAVTQFIGFVGSYFSSRQQEPSSQSTLTQLQTSLAQQQSTLTHQQLLQSEQKTIDQQAPSLKDAKEIQRTQQPEQKQDQEFKQLLSSLKSLALNDDKLQMLQQQSNSSELFGSNFNLNEEDELFKNCQLPNGFRVADLENDYPFELLDSFSRFVSPCVQTDRKQPPLFQYSNQVSEAKKHGKLNRREYASINYFWGIQLLKYTWKLRVFQSCSEVTRSQFNRAFNNLISQEFQQLSIRENLNCFLDLDLLEVNDENQKQIKNENSNKANEENSNNNDESDNGKDSGHTIKKGELIENSLRANELLGSEDPRLELLHFFQENQSAILQNVSVRGSRCLLYFLTGNFKNGNSFFKGVNSYKQGLEQLNQFLEIVNQITFY